MVQLLKTTAIVGAPFGLVMGLFFAFRFGNSFAFLLGVPAGLLFGLSLAVFGAKQASRFSGKDPFLEGECLLKQGPANHFRGWESVGGWLYLTDRRLLFRSHGLNIQIHELSMPLNEITEVRPCLTAWIIPNGLRVATNRGAERFVVEGRRSWVDQISKAIGCRA